MIEIGDNLLSAVCAVAVAAGAGIGALAVKPRKQEPANPAELRTLVRELRELRDELAAGRDKQDTL